MYSGVYWDVQDTALHDIERIKVIRGPGASLWGANAVNGVINVFTKSAEDAQGGVITTGAGNEEKGLPEPATGGVSATTDTGVSMLMILVKIRSHWDSHETVNVFKGK